MKAHAMPDMNIENCICGSSHVALRSTNAQDNPQILVMCHDCNRHGLTRHNVEDAIAVWNTSIRALRHAHKRVKWRD